MWKYSSLHSVCFSVNFNSKVHWMVSLSTSNSRVPLNSPVRLGEPVDIWPFNTGWIHTLTYQLNWVEWEEWGNLNKSHWLMTFKPSAVLQFLKCQRLRNPFWVSHSLVVSGSLKHDANYFWGVAWSSLPPALHALYGTSWSNHQTLYIRRQS